MGGGTGVILFFELTIIAVSILLAYFGVVSAVWATDLHYIAGIISSFGIAALLSIDKDAKPLYLLSDLAPGVGLVGTVLGLSIALPLFLSAPEQAMAAAGSAFTCTAVGIVFSMLLYLKGWLIERRG